MDTKKSQYFAVPKLWYDCPDKCENKDQFDSKGESYCQNCVECSNLGVIPID